jgi:hypothetical protein
MVKKFDSEFDVRILDFDWSGKQGVVKYPAFLNTSIKWPKGIDYISTRYLLL